MTSALFVSFVVCITAVGLRQRGLMKEHWPCHHRVSLKSHWGYSLQDPGQILGFLFCPALGRPDGERMKSQLMELEGCTRYTNASLTDGQRVLQMHLVPCVLISISRLFGVLNQIG